MAANLALMAVYVSLAVFGYEVKSPSLVIGNVVAAMSLLWIMH